MTEEIATYATNGIAIDNLPRFWPKGQMIPALITDVAALIAPWPWGMVSHVYITGSRPNDYMIENGADLWNQFGMFMGFANRTEYARLTQPCGRSRRCWLIISRRMTTTRVG